MIIIICVICGKEIRNPRLNQKTCSRKCGREYRKAYQKAYKKTDKYKAYQKAYQKAYYQRKKLEETYDKKSIKGGKKWQKHILNVGFAERDSEKKKMQRNATM